MPSRVATTLSTVWNFLNRRELLIFLYVGLSLLLIWALLRSGSESAWPVMISHGGAICVAVLLSVVFSVVRAVAWQISLRVFKIPISLLESLKLFYVGAFIDLVTIPSRVTSDIYRTGYLKAYPLENRVKAILLFRVSTVAPFSILTALYFLQQSPWWMLVVVPLIFVIWHYQIHKKLASLGSHWGTILVVAGTALLAIGIEFMRAAVILSIFGYIPNFDFLLWWVVSHTIGNVSGIPLGFGARDISLAYFVQGYLSARDIAVYLILSRLTGEIWSGVLGWFLASKDTLKLVRTKTS